MVFRSNLFPEDTDNKVFEDRFREVEIAVAFRRLTCYRCESTALYRYQVQQIRRKPEIGCTQEEEIRSDHQALWQSIPRFAEIPETIKCKNCGEPLGVYPTCVY